MDHRWAYGPFGDVVGQFDIRALQKHQQACPMLPIALAQRHRCCGGWRPRQQLAQQPFQSRYLGRILLRRHRAPLMMQVDMLQTVRAVTRTQEPDWLATHLDCRPSTLAQWCMGRTIPTLPQWVRIAALLGSDVHAVLTQSPQRHPNLAVPAISTPRPPAGRQRDKTAIQAYLVATLADRTTPPVSLRAVARHLGEHSTVLQRWFPDLCRAISQRYLADQQARREGRENHLKL
jgi:hypothetical protein